MKELNCTYNYDIIHVVALYHFVAIGVELICALGFLAHYTLLRPVLPYSRKYSIFFSIGLGLHIMVCFSLPLSCSFFLLPSFFPSHSPSLHLSFSLPPFFLTWRKLCFSFYPESSLVKLFYWTDIIIIQL